MELSQLNNSTGARVGEHSPAMNQGAGVRTPGVLSLPRWWHDSRSWLQFSEPQFSWHKTMSWTPPPLVCVSNLFKSSTQFYEIIMFLRQSWAHRGCHSKPQPIPPPKSTLVGTMTHVYFLSYTQRYSCKICFKLVFIFRHLGQCTQFDCRISHPGVAPLASYGCCVGLYNPCCSVLPEHTCGATYLVWIICSSLRSM